MSPNPDGQQKLNLDGLQFWVTRRGAIVVEDGTFSYVQPAERDGAKGDGPDVVVDLFETDVVSTEQVRDVDPEGVPSDTSIP